MNEIVLICSPCDKNLRHQFSVLRPKLRKFSATIQDLINLVGRKIGDQYREQTFLVSKKYTNTKILIS